MLWYQHHHSYLGVKGYGIEKQTEDESNNKYWEVLNELSGRKSQ